MTLSRWKLMAVGLGVSLGGLAAMAGQCPKPDSTKGRTAEAPPAVDVPLLPPVAKATPELPPLPVPGASTPVVPPASIPDSPPPLPVPAAEPAKAPDLPVSNPATPSQVPASSSDLPKLPQSAPVDVIPVPSTTPSLPPAAPMADVLPRPMPTEPGMSPAGVIYSKPSPRVNETPAVDVPPPTGGSTTVPAMPPVSSIPTAGDVTPVGRTTPATANIGAAATLPLNTAKFRILLRVGEGEPSFEVKNGDDLVLKVVCEKVDIASPEKGSGPSIVKASGKVRFAGFGAEGVCDELSFLAGTGEVKMAGDVNIKVKDKLGRVESEFTTASVKYKLDPSVPTGSR